MAAPALLKAKDRDDGAGGGGGEATRGSDEFSERPIDVEIVPADDEKDFTTAGGTRTGAGGRAGNADDEDEGAAFGGPEADGGAALPAKSVSAMAGFSADAVEDATEALGDE